MHVCPDVPVRPRLKANGAPAGFQAAELAAAGEPTDAAMIPGGISPFAEVLRATRIRVHKYTFRPNDSAHPATGSRRPARKKQEPYRQAYVARASTA